MLKPYKTLGKATKPETLTSNWRPIDTDPRPPKKMMMKTVRDTAVNLLGVGFKV